MPNVSARNGRAIRACATPVGARLRRSPILSCSPPPMRRATLMGPSSSPTMRWTSPETASARYRSREPRKPMPSQMSWKYLTSIALFLAFAVGAATAQTVGPPAGYAINQEYTVKSPDGGTTIEQYKKTSPDDDLTCSFGP